MKKDAVFTTWATSCVNMRRCSYTSLVTHVRYTLSLIHADRHRKSDDKVRTWMRATLSLPRDSAELFLAGENRRRWKNWAEQRSNSDPGRASIRRAFKPAARRSHAWTFRGCQLVVCHHPSPLLPPFAPACDLTGRKHSGDAGSLF